ncbi:bifunctional nicotinamide mononucleotide adenylyltransferase/ADP-ribose pyrophosphatase [Xanthomonas fragariae]|uniref:Bifunctional NMN adenylyltransferase/Nudix hydrolase n=1 Tax=Xanthomonas fragariae TaxID=48664 RepID=A0A1Y6GZP4_9XANT|nr:bifunctional nicotinamide mononucleotide adenylyltransferase/ADP-ribose pyrophosphatase [Xanthomonas fragariae]SMR00643.1 Bifunctional NMN adenylyltransferase/Nudix hydrolase [Xanthomonas fragariae]SMR01908.1 bifunctional nicotinamide mononucleotide adenylyltransferase/ADP-ribose pyrophosphatase [Xanthomonas fragariae]
MSRTKALDGCLRELREETRLKVAVPVLKGASGGRHVFDHPERSLWGRTITPAFHVECPAGELPALRGGDNGHKVHWIRARAGVEAICICLNFSLGAAERQRAILSGLEP